MLSVGLQSATTLTGVKDTASQMRWAEFRRTEATEVCRKVQLRSQEYAVPALLHFFQFPGSTTRILILLQPTHGSPTCQICIDMLWHDLKQYSLGGKGAKVDVLQSQGQARRPPLQALPVQPTQEDPGSDADSEDEFLAQVCSLVMQSDLLNPQHEE